MYTIAYRLHSDGYLEPFSVKASQPPTQPYLTIIESNDEWVLRGHHNGNCKYLGHFSYQEDTEAVGRTWLEQLP